MSQLEVDKIIPQSGTTLTIGDSGDTVNFADGTALSIDTNTLYIDSTNNRVGIGTASPNFPLEINSSAQTTLLHLVSTAGTTSAITFANTGSNDSITIGAENDDLKLRTDDGVIKFFTNENSEKMRITSAGNVGIGTTSPSQPLTVSSSTTNAPLKLITTGSQTYSGIVFESTQSDDYVGIGVDGENLKLRTDDGHITFHVAENSEKMRIDSSGRLLVGKTASNFNTVGAEIRNDGRIFGISSGNNPITLNRKTDDGTIIDLRKDGTEVGSISTKSSDLSIGTGDTGINFYDGGNQVLPFNISTNNYLDNTIDLGSDGYRFNDLYLGGGLYVGGTGTANKLDDYEEGTFTPTIEGSSPPGTATYGLQLGKYTKVGNKVTIQLQVNWSSGTGGGTAMYVKGLPFTQSSGFIQSLTIGFINGVTLASNTYAHANIVNNSNYIRLFDEVVGGGATGDVGYDSGGEIGIGGTYIID